MLACALALSLFPAQSEDLFLYLAFGRRIFNARAFPATDPFLVGYPGGPADWMWDWASQLGAYLLYLAGGWTALVLVKVLFVLLGAGATLWLARKARDATFVPLALLLLALWAGCDRFVEHSSLLSDMLGAWVLALLCADRLAEPGRSGRRVWWIPPVLGVWINFHPGFLTALAYLFTWAATSPRQWRRTVPVALAATAAVAVQPLGARDLLAGAGYFLGESGRISAQYIQEAIPTLSAAALATREVRLFLLLVLAVAALAIGAARRRALTAFGLVCLAELCLLGFTRKRMVTTAAFALPVLAVYLQACAREAKAAGRFPAAFAAPGSRLNRAGLRATAAAALLLAAGIFLFGYSSTASHFPRRTGVGLDSRVARLRNGAERVAGLHLTGSVYPEYILGGFLAWQWDGNPRLVYHGHIPDMDYFETEYLDARRSAEGFDRVVAKYGIDVFFLEDRGRIRADSGLPFGLLLTRPEWHLIYWDDQVVVFLKERPEYRERIAQNELRYFDPFRPERIAEGLRVAPEKTLAEATLALRWQPEGEWIRRMIRETWHREPEELLR